MPAHQRLAQGFDNYLIGQLERANLIMTWGWSARAILRILIQRTTESSEAMIYIAMLNLMSRRLAFMRN